MSETIFDRMEPECLRSELAQKSVRRRSTHRSRRYGVVSLNTLSTSLGLCDATRSCAYPARTELTRTDSMNPLASWATLKADSWPNQNARFNML